MKHFIEKEYHPVIENYITEYVEGDLDPGERGAFEEVLVHNDDLRELAFSAKGGKRLIEEYISFMSTNELKQKLSVLLKNFK